MLNGLYNVLKEYVVPLDCRFQFHLQSDEGIALKGSLTNILLEYQRHMALFGSRACKSRLDKLTWTLTSRWVLIGL